MLETEKTYICEKKQHIVRNAPKNVIYSVIFQGYKNRA